jgi:archaeosortase B (VPXXXP-CTERM-specific)
MLRVCGVFFGCLAGCVALLTWAVGEGSAAMMSSQRALAETASFFLRLLGNDTTVNGVSVVSTRFTLDIIPACTGLFVLGAFLSAVIAFPARWRGKLAGLALGVGAICVTNIVRLITLFYVGAYWPRYFDYAHLVVWQTLVIAISVLLWLAWAARVGRVRQKT